MDFRTYACLALACLTAIGCRRDPYMDAYFDMLNAEKRVLEDRLYQAQYDYKQAQKQLDACRTGKSAPRRPSQPTPETAPPTDNAPAMPDIELPPGITEPTGQRPRATIRRTSLLGQEQPASPGTSPESDAAPVVQALATTDLLESDSTAQPVDHIYLNPRLTGGLDLDGIAGDEALTVLIEPRNRAGEFVPAAGDVAIVLLDPQLQGLGARFARWDFKAQVAEQFLRDEALNRGLLFRLPWSHPPPAHGSLHLFVRYTTPDGRQLGAESVIHVRVAAPVQDRWTPRPDRPSEPQPVSTTAEVRPAPWTPNRSRPSAQ